MEYNNDDIINALNTAFREYAHICLKPPIIINNAMKHLVITPRKASSIYTRMERYLYLWEDIGLLVRRNGCLCKRENYSSTISSK